jgi:hypothetical protein
MLPGKSRTRCEGAIEEEGSDGCFLRAASGGKRGIIGWEAFCERRDVGREESKIKRKHSGGEEV